MKAYILITTETGRTVEVQRKLAALDPGGVRVRAVDIVAGGYDVIMVVEADDATAIERVILAQLRPNSDGIERAQPLFQLRPSPRQRAAGRSAPLPPGLSEHVASQG